MATRSRCLRRSRSSSYRTRTRVDVAAAWAARTCNDSRASGAMTVGPANRRALSDARLAAEGTVGARPGSADVNLLGDRRSSSAGPIRGGQRGRRDWRACSGRARGSRSRCIPSARTSGAAARRSGRRSSRPTWQRVETSLGAWALDGAELGKLGADLVEREADALGEDDEGDPAEHRSRVVAMARARPLGADQPSLLIKAKRGGGDAASTCDLSDREQIGHGQRVGHHVLDFKLTLTCTVGRVVDQPRRTRDEASKNERANPW